jgi:hypothetical protein
LKHKDVDILILTGEDAYVVDITIAIKVEVVDLAVGRVE